jgi:glycosyltransferase involved in cell wall biosynthesis
MAQRIMHVLSGDLWAGAEEMAHTLLRELVHNFGIQTHAVVLNEGELVTRLRRDDIGTTVLDESKLSAWQILRRLNQLAVSWQPQLIHTHRKKENILGSLVARSIGATSLRTVHGWTEFPRLGISPAKHLSRHLDRLCGRVLQKKIVAVSDELRNRLVTEFGSSNICVIENGVDIRRVRELANKGSASLPGHPDARRIGIVARLVPVKRHDRFVRIAAALLEASSPDYEFYIVGDGPGFEAIEALIRAGEYGDKIHMLGFRADVLPVIRTMDVIVVTSDHEGVPMNVLEAAALGVPVVSVPLASIEAILASGAPGAIARNDSDEALRIAIEETLSGEAAASRQAVDEKWRFSAKSMAGQYVELYNQLLATP